MNNKSPDACDPISLKNIVEKWNESFSKPRLVKENIPFTVVDDDDHGEDDICGDYSLNVNHPFSILADCCEQVIGRGNWETTWSYSTRIQSAFSFIIENERDLERKGLIKNTESHQLVASIVYEAAATCKIGKRGFSLKDMMKQIKKLEPNQHQ